MVTNTLYLFLCLPGSCLHWGPRSRGERKIYLWRTSYMCDNFIASVVICLLSIQISPKRLQTHCGCLFSHRPVFWHDPICPRSVLIFDGCSLCFILRRAFSLPYPSLLLLKCVISPSHHQRTPKTARRHFFFFKNKNLRQGSGKAFTKRRSQKCQNLEKRKRDQDVIIPRSVSTFVAGEKATPAVRLSFYSLHKAYICVHTETHVHILL